MEVYVSGSSGGGSVPRVYFVHIQPNKNTSQNDTLMEMWKEKNYQGKKRGEV